MNTLPILPEYTTTATIQKKKQMRENTYLKFKKSGIFWHTNLSKLASPL